MARRVAIEARRLIAGLRPAALDPVGLAGALEQRVVLLRAGIRIGPDGCTTIRAIVPLRGTAVSCCR
jgi:hypothetical protein